MPITLKEAKALGYRDPIHSDHWKNSDGTPERWRVNGVPKTWKTRPLDVQVPIKHGMRDYGYLKQTSYRDEHGEWHVASSNLPEYSLGDGRW